MADNVTLNAGSGGDSVRTVDKAGQEAQVIIVDVGSGATESLLTEGQKAMANSVPVVVASDQSDLPAAQAHTRNEAFKEAAAVGGELDDTAPVAATEGNVSPARITAQRALHANLRNNAGTEVGTSADPVRVDPTGTTRQSVNMNQINGSLVVTGGVAASQGVGGLAADGAAVAGNPVLVAGFDGTNAQTILLTSNGRQIFAAGAAAADGGSNTLSVPFTSATQSFKLAVAGHMFNGSTWDRIRGTAANGLDVDITRVAAGANLIGDVGLSGARTSGGTTIYKNIDVDESEDAVKASAGQIYWIHAMNLSAATLFLKFYDATVATVVVGTTVPDLTFPLPTQGDTNGAGFTLSIPNGIAFGTAITVAATTGIADADSGAPGANQVVLNLGFA